MFLQVLIEKFWFQQNIIEPCKDDLIHLGNICYEESVSHVTYIISFGL